MKKYISLFGLLFSFSALNAQDLTDALRYSQNQMNGTARFRALSGSFGAIGGDLSAVSSNPASSVIFTNNQIAITANSYFTQNESSFFGTKNKQKVNDFDFNQIGGVFVFQNNDESSNWKKFAVALNYELQNNFVNNIYFDGINPSNSIDKYFLSYANSIPFGSINNLAFENMTFSEQQTALAYDSFLIDDNGVDPVYFTNISENGNYSQSNSVISTGYNGKMSFNASAQYNDNLMIGINLNSHFSNYSSSKRFTERNSNPKYSSGRTVDTVVFDNNLLTTGSGFSFQIGGIYKVTPELRLGISYESPTWMELNDEFSQKIITSGFGLTATNIDNTIYSTVVNDPNLTMIYNPYTLVTPDKWSFSAAYVFGKKGFINFDYSTKNYSGIEFTPNNEFKNLNNGISEFFTNSQEFRIGVEHKIKQWRLRGGYRFEGSPYKDKKIMGDLNGYSGGVGYSWGGTKLDFAYSVAKRNFNEQLFNRGLTDPATIHKRNSDFTITLAFEL